MEQNLAQQDIFADLQPVLSWLDIPLTDDLVVAAASLQRGEQLQLILAEPEQQLLLRMWLDSDADWLGIVQKQKSLKTWGHAVGMVLNGRALLANITIQENIMLPFLYHNQQQYNEQAHIQLDKVAATLGLDTILHEQTGLRSPLIHGLVALCRCVLQQTSFIIMQQPCSNMSVQEAEIFRPLAQKVVQRLGAGLLYMTDNIDDDGGFQFEQRLGFQQDTGLAGMR